MPESWARLRSATAASTTLNGGKAFTQRLSRLGSRCGGWTCGGTGFSDVVLGIALPVSFVMSKSIRLRAASCSLVDIEATSRVVDDALIRGFLFRTTGF